MFGSIEEILGAMGAAGAESVFGKVLAANDNSKQQVYLGGGFATLNILPHGDITLENGQHGGAVRDRNHASLDFRWLDEDGQHPVPNAKLILYPRYPEVRFSGFLAGCRSAPNDLMGSGRRIPGRVLFLGVCGDGRILGHVVAPDHAAASAFSDWAGPRIGVFADLSGLIPGGDDPRDRIVGELRVIAAAGWLRSVKLDAAGVAQDYVARNGAGYTLEAALGIRPNGRAEPDFHGWEVKQFAVNDLDRRSAKGAVTLMTPEPDGGLYAGDLPRFLAEYGYADQNGVTDRWNFGGIYRVGGPPHRLTGLSLVMTGFDASKGKLEDAPGALCLVDRAGCLAATWSFEKLLRHWMKKHARAAYVPCVKRDPPPEYRYSAAATLYTGTDFFLLLHALANGAVYLDPAIKGMRSENGFGPIRRRCQFRVRHGDLFRLYSAEEVLDA